MFYRHRSPALSYSFNLEEYKEEDEIGLQSKLPQASLPDTIQNRLKELLSLLEKNITNLVQDVEPIRRTFLAIKDQLQPNLLEALAQVANIEDYAPKVKKARRNLMDHDTLLAKKDSNKQEAKALVDLIDDLKKSSVKIVLELEKLKARHSELEQELLKVNTAIERHEFDLTKLQM